MPVQTLGLHNRTENKKQLKQTNTSRISPDEKDGIRRDAVHTHQGAEVRHWDAALDCWDAISTSLGVSDEGGTLSPCDGHNA